MIEDDDDDPDDVEKTDDYVDEDVDDNQIDVAENP